MDDIEFQKLLNTPVPGGPSGDSGAAGAGGVPAAEPRVEGVPATPSGASLGGAWQSVGVGMAKAGFETYDFIMGEPAETDKTHIRREVEAKGEKFANDSWVNAALIPISQFVTGMIGAGKIKHTITGAKAGLKAVGRTAKIGSEVATAAAVGGVVFDPHEERLSNVVESFPALRNPVTDYLSADPKDSAAEGRFKTMLESVGMDAVTLGAFKAGAKLYKAVRRGKRSEIAAAQEEVNAAASQAAEAQVVEAVEGAAPESGRDWLRVGDVLDEIEGVQVDDVNVAVVSSPADAQNAQGLAPVRRPPPVEEFPEELVLRIQKQTSKDAAALDQFGSRADAEAAGHQFGGLDVVPWQKLDTPDGITNFYQRVVDTQLDAFTKAKGGNAAGVLTDDEVRRLVFQRVEAWGENPDQVRGILAAAGKHARQLAVEAETAHVLGTKAMDEAYRVLQKMQWGNLAEYGGDGAAAMKDFVRRAGVAVDLVAKSSGMFSNAGRTLRRARGDVGKFSFAEIRKMQDLPPKALAKLFEQSGGDVRALRQLLRRPSMMSRVRDYANFLLVNNLLWGWTTQAVNLTTNAAMVLGRPLERIVGGAVLSGVRAVKPDWVASDFKGAGAASKENLRQYRYMAASLVDGARAAGRAFIEGDSILSPYQIEHFSNAGAAGTGTRIEWKPVNSVGDLISNAVMATKVTIGLPTRALGVVDEFSRQITYRSMIAAKAAGEADARGLTGQVARDHIRKAIEGAYDTNGRALDARALQESMTVAFQQELLQDTMGHTTQSVVAKHPWLRQVLPYVRTPVNVLRTSVKLTPGLNLLQREYREMIKGNLGADAQAQAIGQMSLGSLLLGAAATFAADGRLTGSGPADPKVRANLSAAGWKPNSYLRQNDDGTITALQFGRFDPYGMLFGMVADIADIMQHPERRTETQSALSAVALALFSQVRERTYVRNLVEMFDALSDPGERGEKFIGRMASNLVPFSGALRNYGGQQMDYLREAQGIIDSIKATIPGLADGVPLKYDAFGEPIRIRRGPWSTIEDNIVDREVIRMGLESGFTFPSPVPHHDGADLRDITMEDGRNAYEVYQQYAGKLPGAKVSLKQTLAKIIASPGYQKAPDGPSSERGTKQYMLAGPAADHREKAKRVLMRSKIVRDALSESSRKVRDAYIAKKVNSDGRVEAQEAQSAIGGLLNTLGLGD